MRSRWSSPIFHEPTPDDRNRDIFPLPRLRVDAVQKHSLCRATSRRILCRARIAERANQAIDSLNSLFFGTSGFPTGEAVGGLDGLPLLQREAITSILSAVRTMGAPPTATDSGALKALRVAASAYFEPEVSVGDVVPLQLERLSLPDGSGAGVELRSALDSSLQGVVDNFEGVMLQDPDIWTSISRDCAHLKPYSDPSLKDRSKYLTFLRMMYGCGILSFVNRCRGRVGAFTVSKKPKNIGGVTQQRQRLVLDCRQTNLLFKPSPHTELGSLASLAEVDLPNDATLFLGGADIQDCFYGVHIPTEMMEFFCFEFDISGADASWVSGGQYTGADDTMVSPCVNVLPMGFSWSFYLVQHIHQHAVLRSLDITEGELFLDARPPPLLHEGSIYSMPYCDNIHCLSLERDRCEHGKQAIVDELSNMGFCIHEDAPASHHFETLGGLVDGEAGHVRMTNRRAWDLKLAFEHAASHVVSPDIMRRLLGHAMFFATLNRSGMSVFRRCYDFIESNCEPRMLNKQESRECIIFSGLIPLLFADIKRGWSDVITCTDASPDGFGICEQRVGGASAQRLGRWNERWRFKRLRPEEWAPRRRALQRDPVCDPITVTGLGHDGDYDDDLVKLNEDFPEVDCQLLRPSLWKTVLMGKWRSHEHITLKEGRALIICLRRLSRSSHSRNKKHVILVDNFSLALAVSKGRAKNFRLLRITQQVAALSLAAGLGLRLRWLPSELNPADGPSRGQIQPGAYRQFADSAHEDESEEVPDTKAEGGEKDESKQLELKQADGQAVDLPHLEAEGCSSESCPSTTKDGWSYGDGACRDVGTEGPVEASYHAGDPFGVQGGATSISTVPGEVREFLPGQRIGMASSQQRGRHSCRLLGRAVSRWRLGGGGRESGCRSGVRADPSQRHFGAVPAGFEGMEARTSSSKPTTFASSDCLWNGNGHGCSRKETDVLETHGGPRHVPQTWREHRATRTRHSSSSSKCRSSVSLAFRDCQGQPGPQARQGGDLRQFSASEFSRPRVSRPLDDGSGEQAEQQGRFHIPILCSRVQEVLSERGRVAQHQKFASLSNSSWRSFRGPEQWRKRCSDREDQRSMAYRSKRAKIRKSWEDPTTDGNFVTKSLGVLSVVASKHGENAQGPCDPSTAMNLGWMDVFSISSLPERFCLEIFSGTARITDRLNFHNIPTFPIDICLFPSHNVLHVDVEHTIVHWIQQRRIAFIWLGMPCTSFSQARKLDDVGPGPLRDYDNLFGFPWLSAGDRFKVEQGNQLLRFSIRILELCQQYSIPYALENPATSYIWYMPPMLKFRRKYDPGLVIFDFCQYGEDWKKPTAVVGNFWNLHTLNKRCTGTFKCCSATHRPHVPLAGLSTCGIFRTLLAQPYPWKLAALIAEQVAKVI